MKSVGNRKQSDGSSGVTREKDECCRDASVCYTAFVFKVVAISEKRTFQRTRVFISSYGSKLCF
jgi:hypothetical protein